MDVALASGRLARCAIFVPPADKRSPIHCCSGESAIFYQQAVRKSHILRDVLKPGPHPYIAHVIARQSCVADDAGAAKFFLRHLTMKFELFGEIALDLTAPDDVPEASKELSHDGLRPGSELY